MNVPEIVGDSFLSQQDVENFARFSTKNDSSAQKQNHGAKTKQLFESTSSIQANSERNLFLF